MNTFPPDSPAPTPGQIATYLRERAVLAARRSVTLCAHDIDTLLAAASLLELAFPPAPVTAGETA